MTDLNINYSELWVEADPDADPLAWARNTVAQRWAEEGLPADPELAEAIAENMADIIGTAFEQDPAPFMLFLLYPLANIPALAAVAVRTEPCDEASLDQLAEEIRLPGPMLERPVDQCLVDTPAGPALRLIQRYRAPIEPGIEQVQELIAHTWVVHDGDGHHLVIIATSFTDLVNAGEWRPAVDELAQSLQVHP